jgi:hypothetical protein
MTNGKTPLYLTVALGLLAGALVFAWQPYSVTSRWARYAGPMQSYLRAALRRDSLALVRQTGSAEAVAWALHAARAHPEALTVWTRHAHPSWGLEIGDTATIGLDSDTNVCSEHPIVLRFVTGKVPRVIEASSACFENP